MDYKHELEAAEEDLVFMIREVNFCLQCPTLAKKYSPTIAMIDATMNSLKELRKKILEVNEEHNKEIIKEFKGEGPGPL